MSDQEEVERLLNVLRTSVRLLGLTSREIERRLGLTPSYVSRIFSGTIELKMEHVLAITRAIGLQPWEFFELAYPQRPNPHSASFQAIQTLLRGMQPSSPPAAGPTEEELNQRIEDAVNRAMETIKTWIPPGVEPKSDGT